MTTYVKSRADPQFSTQSAEYTEEMASRACQSAGSGLRPGSSRMQSTIAAATSNSEEEGSRHQPRESSDDSDDDDGYQAHEHSDDDSADEVVIKKESDVDVNTEEGRLRETYMRRGKGEWEPENRETIRPLNPSLQSPRLVYPRIK